MEFQSDFLTWLHISEKYTKTQQDIILGVSYVPYQRSKYYNEDDFATLEVEVMSTYSKNEHVYLTGDFNAQTAKLRDFTSSDRSLDNYLDFDQKTIGYI